MFSGIWFTHNTILAYLKLKNNILERIIIIMEYKKYFKDIKTIVEIEDENEIYKLQKVINFSIIGKNSAKIYIGDDDDQTMKFNIYIKFIDDESKEPTVELDLDDDTYYYNFINWDKLKKGYDGKDIKNLHIKKSHIANITNEDDNKVYELYTEINIIIFNNKEETKIFTLNLYTKEA
jgi:hypothetical protein